MRRATALVLPAFIASRVESRGLLVHLCKQLQEQVGIDGIVEKFDSETHAAETNFASRLSAAGAAQARNLIEETAATRRTTASTLHADNAQRSSALTGDGIILPAGAEDSEQNPNSLQAALCAIVDNETAINLQEELGAPDTQNRRRRISEMRDSSVSHDWL